MAEWFNATVLKTVESKAPGVRIPLPPFGMQKSFSGCSAAPQNKPQHNRGIVLFYNDVEVVISQG